MREIQLLLLRALLNENGLRCVLSQITRNLKHLL